MNQEESQELLKDCNEAIKNEFIHVLSLISNKSND
jgi:hypothetical protein